MGTVERVGVRELKTHASRIVRRVSEEGEPVDITVRGEVVARLVPARSVQMQRRHVDPEEHAARMARVDELAAEVAKYWPDGVSAVDAVNDVRRDL